MAVQVGTAGSICMLGGGYTRDPSPIVLGFPRPLLLKVQFIEQQNGSPWELVRNALRPQPY